MTGLGGGTRRISSSNIHVWPLVGASAVLAAVAVARGGAVSGGSISQRRASCGSCWPKAAWNRPWPEPSSACSSPPPRSSAPIRRAARGREQPCVDLLRAALFALANTGSSSLALHTEPPAHRRHRLGEAPRQDARDHARHRHCRVVRRGASARGVSWPMLVGTSAACGMGFTVPLLSPSARSTRSLPARRRAGGAPCRLGCGVPDRGAILLISTSGHGEPNRRD